MAYNYGDPLKSKPADTQWDTISSPNDNPELSTVDQKWGLLFDKGSPTERFGQFTRGIANYIKDVYVPEKTLAIPPAKMAKFYATYKLKNENYPLGTIFQALPHDHISWIYRYLGCEYHLVQDEDLNKAPTIPALTPFGFSRWMTLFVLAYPSEESQRLDKVVLMMPIDADGVLIERKPERLPKQLSRHLLPLKRSREPRELLKFALPGKDLATSSQTSSKIPIINSKSSSSPTKHHDDPYSKESSNLENHSAKSSLRTHVPDERHVHFRHGRQTNSTQQRREKAVVHNTK
ncbi:hypothetical protein B0J14DRAFT_183390 [Halenospora varia]|nr:hypothetical protein B0J14DRAFT_183390 [Halenospora varia]